MAIAKVRALHRGSNKVEFVQGPFHGQMHKMEGTLSTLVFTAKGMTGRYTNLFNNSAYMYWEPSK